MKIETFIFYIFIIVFIQSTLCNYKKHNVKITRLNGEYPFINYFEKPTLAPKSSHQIRSEFRYNYNSASIKIEHGPKKGKMALIVRVQDKKSESSSIYEVGPSKLAIITQTDDSNIPINFEKPTKDKIILAPKHDLSIQDLGVEDPRIIYNENDNTYYMFYTAVKNVSTGRPSDLGKVSAQLALATCKSTDQQTITDESCWKIRGLLFDPTKVTWSKSGALIIQPKAPHYLYWGDRDISIATSDNLINYKDSGKLLIERRKNNWDSFLCESGPPPLKLSDGNYLFLYNSGRLVDYIKDFPNHRNYTIQYNLGYVVIDKNDLTKVLYRSEKPILTPEKSWERCDIKSIDKDRWDLKGLMPNVVFIEGWVALEKDKFLVYYQGCDSFTSAFILDFKFDKEEKKPVDLTLIFFICALVAVFFMFFSIIFIVSGFGFIVLIPKILDKFKKKEFKQIK